MTATPNDSGRLWTTLGDSSGIFQSHPESSGVRLQATGDDSERLRLRTTPNDSNSGQLQTTPYDSRRLWTSANDSR